MKERKKNLVALLLTADAEKSESEGTKLTRAGRGKTLWSPRAETELPVGVEANIREMPRWLFRPGSRDRDSAAQVSQPHKLPLVVAERGQLVSHLGAA